MSRLFAARLGSLPLGFALLASAAVAQQPSVPAPAPADKHTLIPMPMPTVPRGALELMKLEGDFENAVAKGGGKAFASWFAEDAVTLNNGQVWEQAESRTGFWQQPGQTVTITPGVLGSFFLTDDQHQRVRVKRIL